MIVMYTICNYCKLPVHIESIQFHLNVDEQQHRSHSHQFVVGDLSSSHEHNHFPPHGMCCKNQLDTQSETKKSMLLTTIIPNQEMNWCYVLM